MPLLGKRKYINEKIKKLINKLDVMGYDTEMIKRRFYDIEDDENEVNEGNRIPDFGENILSSGSILSYRNKINDVLKMIENLIKPTETKQYIEPLNYTISQDFKNNLLNQVNNQNENINKNNSFNLF